MSVQSQTRPLRCEFETKTKTRFKTITKDKWDFYRASNVVAHVRTGRSDIWTLMGKQVALEQRFDAHQVILESTPGDLRAAGIAREWNALAEIVDVELLAKLHRKGAKALVGYKAERYRGKVGGIEWEIWWIPELRLAGKIVQTSGQNRSETILKRVEQRSMEICGNNYRRIDYADIGDLENDPIVHRILGESHHHNHQH